MRMVAGDLNRMRVKASDSFQCGWKYKNADVTRQMWVTWHICVTVNTLPGELKSVTPEMVDGCWETSFTTLLSNFELKVIYNAADFGLIYECLPNKTSQLKSEKCSGGKLSKIRSTGLAVANAVGDK